MIWVWIAFLVLIVLLLALDLGVLNRRPHLISFREALGWTAFWVFLSLLFNVLVFFLYQHHWLGIGVRVGHDLSGREAALQFITSYLVEKSLSLDNIFVISLVFSYFSIPRELQHRVLFWGILGALVMRGLMIGLGIAGIERFSWLVYVFGGLLVITALKMLFSSPSSFDPQNNWLLRFAYRLFPVTDTLHEHHFFVKVSGRWVATPLMVALVFVETSDLLFAIDSIPAVFAVTMDPFIAFTSNVFAILGLRSLYFALAAVIDRYRYLKLSLVFILLFIGVKMVLLHHFDISELVSLAVVFGALAAGVTASMLLRTDESAKDSNLAQSVMPSAETVHHTIRRIRRGLMIVAGFTLLLIGVALLVLPGPGLPIVLAGLSILATEYVWARVWMRRAREGAGRVGREAKKIFGG